MRKYSLLLIMLLMLATVSVAQAGVTVTIADFKDTGLASPQATWAPGEYQFMNADNFSGNGERRMLMQFDLSSIPAGSIITSAVVRVYRYSSADNTAGLPFAADRVTASWTEGEGQSNGSNPNSNGAGWLYRSYENNLLWATPGGDYDVSSQVSFLGVTVLGGDANANWGMMPNITGIAQYWVDNPSQNYGLLIRSLETSYARHAMRAREYFTTNGGGPELNTVPHRQDTSAPTIVITYEAGQQQTGAVPEPVGLGLVGMVLLALRKHRS